MANISIFTISSCLFTEMSGTEETEKPDNSDGNSVQSIGTTKIDAVAEDEASSVSSTSLIAKTPSKNTEIKNNELQDLQQQLSDLNGCGGNNFMFGAEDLIIQEHKTPKKTPAKCKRPNSSKKKVKKKECNNWSKEMDNIISENVLKSNLSTANVKQILKHIVTNEQVLAMVKNTMGETSTEGSSTAVYEPKLTRSKTKELIEKNEKVPWPISPAKTVTASDQKIIEAEFAEDESSDEEYTPPQKDDDDSDGDSFISCHVSDFGSPMVAASPICCSSPVQPPPVEIVAGNSNDSQPLDNITISESDLIASRTRSKLPLVETPLEFIESQFVAPDITLDMYDTACLDEEWQQFLQDFIQPIDGQIDNVEEDNDPEYNFMDDENKEDEWERRDDKAVKISKVEVNDLMEDLLECFEGDLNEETGDNQNIILHTQLLNLPPPTQDVTQEIEPTFLNPSPFNENTYQELAVQLNKHVQLLTQVYLLSAERSMSAYMQSAKYLLLELKKISSHQNSQTSIFTKTNLDNALNLVDAVKVDTLVLDERLISRTVDVGAEVEKIICNNPVFQYPEILPKRRFNSIQPNIKEKCTFTVAEDGLLAFGLDQFNTTNLKSCLPNFDEICRYMMPMKTPSQLRIRLKNVKSAARTTFIQNNPLKYYIVHNKLMDTDAFLLQKLSQDRPNNTSLYRKWMQKRKIVHLAYKPIAANNVGKNVHPKKMAIISPNVKIPIVPRVSPLKQLTPILKKYNKYQRPKSPHIKSPLKPILPSINPEILLQAACRIKRSMHGVRRRLMPKMDNDDNESKAATPKTVDHSRQPENSKIMEITKDVSLNNPKYISEKDTVKFLKPTSHLKLDDRPSVQTNANVTNEPESQSDSEDVIEEEVIDKEVDLNALMAASSRISKRNKCTSVKKSKQRREIESSLVLLYSNCDGIGPNEDKASVFAQAYLNRVYEALVHDLDRYEKFVQLLNDFGRNEAISTVQLFQSVKEMLGNHEQLVDEFIGFLLPEDALECGVFSEYLNISRMREFLRKLELHFCKNPQMVQKVVRVFNQFQSQPDFSSFDLKAAVIPLLRGQSHLTNEFIALIPDLKPPENLMIDFEEIDLVDIPEDVSNISMSDEEFEFVVVPENSNDKYGSKQCPCLCHATSNNPRYQSKVKHCASCGTKFIDGRIYLQVGRTLKPAKVTYHTSDNKPSSAQCDPAVVESNKSKASHNVKDSKSVNSKSSSSNKSRTISESTATNVEKSSSLSETVIETAMMATGSQQSDDCLPVSFKNAFASKQNTKKLDEKSEDKSLGSTAASRNIDINPSLKQNDPATCVPIKKRKILSDSRKSKAVKKPVSENKPDPEVVAPNNIEWSRDDDRLLLLKCKEKGAEGNVFQVVADQLKKSPSQVQSRFEMLMELFSKESSNQDDSLSEVSDC